MGCSGSSSLLRWCLCVCERTFYIAVAAPHEIYWYGVHIQQVWYGVATISRLLKIIGLFCRIQSLS